MNAASSATIWAGVLSISARHTALLLRVLSPLHEPPGTRAMRMGAVYPAQSSLGVLGRGASRPMA